MTARRVGAALARLATPGRLQALAVGAAGAGAFHLLSGPLPYLMGPLFACLIASFAGLQLETFGRLNVYMRTVIGLAAGATITPDLVARLSDMVVTVALTPILILLVFAIGYALFRRVFGFDQRTAFYSAAPGGLQEMLIFGDATGANVRTLTLVQATRVLMIVTSVPFLASAVWDVSLTSPRGAPAAEVPIAELAIMVAAAWLGWRAAAAIGLFGATILGPMAAGGALSLADLLHHRPPAEALAVAQFVIGVAIGARYVGVTSAELRRDVLAGVANFAALALVAAAFAEAVSLAGLAPAARGLSRLRAGRPGRDGPVGARGDGGCAVRDRPPRRAPRLGDRRGADRRALDAGALAGRAPERRIMMKTISAREAADLLHAPGETAFPRRSRAARVRRRSSAVRRALPIQPV